MYVSACVCMCVYVCVHATEAKMMENSSSMYVLYVDYNRLAQETESINYPNL